MKILFALTALLAISQAFNVPRFAREHGDLYEGVIGINGTMYNLGQYFNGLFNYFGLQQTEVIECFNFLTSELYFQEMQAFSAYANATYYGDSVSAQQYFALEQSINASLFSTITCMHNTQDWNNLLIAAHVNTFNKTLQGYLNFLYYQAHLSDWYISIAPVFELLKTQNFYQAGKVYGAVFQDIADNSTHSEEFPSALQGLQNGLFAYYNITQPTQLSACYNTTTAQNNFNFIFYWARTVYQSNLTNLTSNTENYFKWVGHQLLGLSQPVWLCENSTSDQWRLNAAIGHDIHGAIFADALENYIYSNQVNYFVIFEQIYMALINVNVFAAGRILGGFYEDVSAFIGPQTPEQ